MDLPTMKSRPISWIRTREDSAPSRVARAFGRVSDASSTATVSERGMGVGRSWQLEDISTYGCFQK